LAAELDAAIEKELLKESGLVNIPREVQATLSKPEYVLKSWRAGSSSIIATNKRVFVRQGIISRRVIDMRYKDIRAIEHARKFPWRTVLVGALISILFLAAPSVRSILSQAFMAQVDELVTRIASALPVFFISDMFKDVLLPLLPLLISIVIFGFRTRTGFSLRGEGIRLQLPGRFKGAISFIRERIDETIDT
jgi:hypothetical protein